MSRERDAEDVGGVVLVSHPQGDSEVGVSPEIVFDHTGGSLGGEDEMQAQ